MKHLAFKLEHTESTKNGVRNMSTEKDVYIDCQTTQGEIDEWIDALKEAVKEGTKMAKKESSSIWLEITRGVNEHDGTHTFDRWYTTSLGFDGGGVHLEPDTQYTEEYWDLYITPKSIRSDIKGL